MKIVAGIFPTQRIADEVARLDIHLGGGELQMKPLTVIKKNGRKELYLTVDSAMKYLIGTELANYYTHYDVKLTQEQKDFLESRKRG